MTGLLRIVSSAFVLLGLTIVLSAPSAVRPQHVDDQMRVYAHNNGALSTGEPPSNSKVTRYHDVVPRAQAPTALVEPEVHASIGSESKSESESEPEVESTSEVISLSPVTALYDQDVVDEGYLVTWMTEPACLLAGHDYAGWAWMASVALGTVIRVDTGPCIGTYEVYDHAWHGWKGGTVPEWMDDIDLILQTCTPDGTGFSLARRLT